MSKYVIMRGGSSPIAIIIPTPVAIRDSLAEARFYVKHRKYPDEYYIRRVNDEK